jgi:hypothetical protein
MDIGSILLGLALLLVVAFVVARPLLAGSRFREREPGAIDHLLFERERLLAQLRDLDFDHATGKIGAGDHAAQRAQLVAQGVAILKQLDAAAPGAGVAGDAQPGSSPDGVEAAVARARAGMRQAPPVAAAGSDDALEALIAQRRQTPAAPATDARLALACHQCGAAVNANDRFCPKCGAVQTRACPHCGRPASPGDQFCGSCGQRLPAAANGLSQAKV